MLQITLDVSDNKCSTTEENSSCVNNEILVYYCCYNTGNLAKYVDSYFRRDEARDDDHIDPLWILAIFFTVFPMSLTLSGYLEKLFGTKKTVGVATAVCRLDTIRCCHFDF